MLTLSFRTDNPEAEIGIFKAGNKVDYEIWSAHRQLAETIHIKIKSLLKSNNVQLSDIEGVLVFQGPGSFTGLRIGITVANALADSLGCPIIGATGEAWLTAGNTKLLAGGNDKLVIPEYGALPNITAPRK